jgi:hypothetical protein
VFAFRKATRNRLEDRVGMWYSQTDTGMRAYVRVVASRSASTTIVLWIQRVMLVTMHAELALWPAKHPKAEPRFYEARSSSTKAA